MKESDLKDVYVFGELDDETVFAAPLTEADDDWIRAARLQRKADARDGEAKKQLEEMQSAGMQTVRDDKTEE